MMLWTARIAGIKVPQGVMLVEDRPESAHGDTRTMAQTRPNVCVPLENRLCGIIPQRAFRRPYDSNATGESR